MTLGLAFWIIMLLWLALGLWRHWGVWGIDLGGSLLVFLLFLLLGWQVFGAPLRSEGRRADLPSTFVLYTLTGNLVAVRFEDGGPLWVAPTREPRT